MHMLLPHHLPLSSPLISLSPAQARSQALSVPQRLTKSIGFTPATAIGLLSYMANWFRLSPIEKFLGRKITIGILCDRCQKAKKGQRNRSHHTWNHSASIAPGRSPTHASPGAHSTAAAPKHRILRSSERERGECLTDPLCILSFLDAN